MVAYNALNQSIASCPPAYNALAQPQTVPNGIGTYPAGQIGGIPSGTCPPSGAGNPQGAGTGTQIGGIAGNGTATCPPSQGAAGAIGALGGTTCPPFSLQSPPGQLYQPGPGGAGVDPNYFRDPVTGLTFETNEPPTGAELPANQALPPGFSQDPATGALVYTGTGGTCPPSQPSSTGVGGTAGTCPPSGGAGLGANPAVPNPLGPIGGISGNPINVGGGPYGGPSGSGGTAPGLTQNISGALDTLSDPATIAALQTQSASNPQIKQQLAGIVNSLQGIGG